MMYMFDQDRSGAISYDELRKILKHLGGVKMYSKDKIKEKKQKKNKVKGDKKNKKEKKEKKDKKDKKDKNTGVF